MQDLVGKLEERGNLKNLRVNGSKLKKPKGNRMATD
jgi:hypothetical protein